LFRFSKTQRQRHGCSVQGPVVGDNEKAAASSMQVIARRAEPAMGSHGCGGGCMFAWGSVAARRDTASFELAACIERTQKRKARKDASMMSASAKQRKESCTALPGACAWRRWRVLACGLFGDKDVRLMKRLAAARGGVGLRRLRHGDQERAERCAGAVPLFCGCLWCPDAEPAT
jgi:hypothetical protein